MSGDGVSPAASAAASRIAAGQRGCDRSAPMPAVSPDPSRDIARMTRSTTGSRSRTIADGVVNICCVVQLPQFADRLYVVCPLAREHLEQNQPERIHVALDRRRSSLPAAPAPCSAASRPTPPFAPPAVAIPKSVNSHVPGAVQHDVRRLEIPMQHAFSCAAAITRAQLPRDLHGLVGRHPAEPAQRARTRSSPSTYSMVRNRRPVGVAQVVQATDVLIGDLPCDSQLVVELREPCSVGGDAGRQEFQGDRLIQRQVVGAVHLAHPAAAQQRHQAIASRTIAPGAKRWDPGVSGAGVPVVVPVPAGPTVTSSKGVAIPVLYLTNRPVGHRNRPVPS